MDLAPASSSPPAPDGRASFRQVHTRGTGTGNFSSAGVVLVGLRSQAHHRPQPEGASSRWSHPMTHLTLKDELPGPAACEPGRRAPGLMTGG